ncbi:GPI transamidase component PIG-S [Paramuricea clavata]|uniref:GPI transamidase component PIG-S n=1 Tax=Paramuricea clavata TaxID=317549 RepID=A0A7D9D7L7_PARCT|nr:GPI transamidase component PIG-S [Paramuricea clavata]
MSVSRYSCSVECSRCMKRFKTSKSMWSHMLKSHQLSRIPLEFLDENNQPITFAKPALIGSSSQLDAYSIWLSTIVERVNEALHPALPGRWTQIEDPCVPEAFVLHFIARIAEETTDLISPVRKALDEQGDLKLRETAVFRNFHEIEDKNMSFEKLSMREKIARMKASSKLGYAERVQVPTSRSSLVISEGEGHGTREVEILHWPELYTVSKQYKFQLRFFIKKCDIQ